MQTGRIGRATRAWCGSRASLGGPWPTTEPLRRVDVDAPCARSPGSRRAA